jgi:hypothetical protein
MPLDRRRDGQFSWRINFYVGVVVLLGIAAAATVILRFFVLSH